LYYKIMYNVVYQTIYSDKLLWKKYYTNIQYTNFLSI